MPESRWQILDEKGIAPRLVEIRDGQYLIDTALEAGPSKIVGMGDEIPISWVDLFAYTQLTQPLESWEARLVLELCAAFLEGKRTGQNPLGIEPIDAAEEDEAWTSQN